MTWTWIKKPLYFANIARYVHLIYKFTTSVLLWQSSGFTPTGPGPSCSQSFLSKDMWFLGWNFLFPEFSFKRSVVSELGVQANWVSVLSVEVLKPKSLLKLSPQSRGPKNYSGPQSHTFTSLLTESRVLSPDQSRSQVPTPRLQRPEW